MPPIQLISFDPHDQSFICTKFRAFTKFSAIFICVTSAVLTGRRFESTFSRAVPDSLAYRKLEKNHFLIFEIESNMQSKTSFCTTLCKELPSWRSKFNVNDHMRPQPQFHASM